MFLNQDLVYAAEKRDDLSKLQYRYRPEDQERMLNDALERTRRVRTAADLLIATAFEENSENLAQQVAMGLDQQEQAARAALAGKHPFHWPLEFPEVFLDRDGFDAVIGNPPFIGGQRITGVLGKSYRDYLVDFLAGGKRGSADYVAYFFLRAFALLRSGGTAGLLATNTIAQGDTREVGLDQLTAYGASIYRAVPSRKWPGDASLEVAWVWWRKGVWKGECSLDEKLVPGITSQLTVPGSLKGKPYRLAANAGKSFQGSIVLGMGFVLEPDEAQRLLDKDPRNADVLFPYLNGEDLNSRWDQSPSRWVINFRDWPIEQAREYPDCFEIVERLVKAERARNNRKVYRDHWWHYAEKRPKLYATIAGLDRVLVTAAVSPTFAFAEVPNTQVFAHKLIVFPFQRLYALATLQSNIHRAWAYQRSSTLGGVTLNYSPSDCFETFPFPETVSTLENIGQSYHRFRQDLMASRQEGLTAAYNRFHNPQETATDIRKLRALHVEMDQAVAAAYGWTDLDLGHGFHQTKQGIRYTISEPARREVLDRLLALNHARHTSEGATTPVSKPARKPVRSAKKEKTSQRILA